MKNTISIGDVMVTIEVARALEAVGMVAADVAEDVATLRSGETTRADLLVKCLSGADDESASDAHAAAFPSSHLHISLI